MQTVDHVKLGDEGGRFVPLFSFVCLTFRMMERWSSTRPYFGGHGISRGVDSLSCALLPTHQKEPLVLKFVHYHERMVVLSEQKRATECYGRNSQLV